MVVVYETLYHIMILYEVTIIEQGHQLLSSRLSELSIASFGLDGRQQELNINMLSFQMNRRVTSELADLIHQLGFELFAFDALSYQRRHLY